MSSSDKSKRGFAAMDPAKQRAISSKGGKAAHALGVAHQFTTEEIVAAGRKGSREAHRRGKAQRFTPEEARIAGRKGARASARRRRATDDAS
jgi:general stress protein YciG